MDTLNDNQKLFVLSPLENAKLLGIPGGGKTTTIIYKILNHFKNKDMKMKSDFLILMFGKKVRFDFINKGNNIYKEFSGKKASLLFNKDNVRTFHSLAGTIIQKLSGRQCSSLQVSIVSAINVIKNNSTENIKKLKCLKNTKLIIIDEAQDMSDIQYNLVKEICENIDSKLILVGDPNQNIYQFQNGSDKYLLEYNGKKYYLTENHRSTPQITQFIDWFRPWKNNLPNMISNLKSGKKPNIFSGTQDEICDHILHELKHTKYKYENIAIIGPVKKSDKKKDGTYVKFGLQKITNLFNKNGIKYLKHYNEYSNDCDLSHEDIPCETGKVNIYTIHGSKGLEFDKIILVNFHFRTFGRVPSEEEYNQFKYMWYVAMSRAKYELDIYVDNDKTCWNEILKCPPELYDVEGDDLIIKVPKFSSEGETSNDIIELINNKTIFNENELLKFYEIINMSEYSEKIFEIKNKDLSNLKKYWKLINNFIKCIFEYYYCLFHLQDFIFVKRIEMFIDNVIYVDGKYKEILKNFLEKSGASLLSTMTLSTLHQHKNKFNKMEKNLLEYLEKKLKYDFKKSFSVSVENEDIFMDTNEIREICENIRKYNDTLWNIFKLCLFEYQYQHESKYMWDNIDDFEDYPNVLMPYIIQIRNFSSTLKDGYQFNKSITHPNLLISGSIDLIRENDRIIQIKFNDNIDLIDKIQTFFQYNLIYYKWNKEKIFEIWNFKTGKRITINFDPIITNLEMSMKIAKICKKKLVNITLMYDLETTGLDVQKCEIIERYFHELWHDCQFSNGIIKCKKKVPSIIHELTGITKKDISNGENINIFKSEISEMLELCKNPILIAHNGNVFDHQVMRNTMEMGNTCKYLDSRIIIRQFSKNRIKNETLSEIYEIVMGHKYKGKAHRAKADVIMLLDIFKKLKINDKNILKFI